MGSGLRQVGRWTRYPSGWGLIGTDILINRDLYTPEYMIIGGNRDGERIARSLEVSMHWVEEREDEYQASYKGADPVDVRRQHPTKHRQDAG